MPVFRPALMAVAAGALLALSGCVTSDSYASAVQEMKDPAALKVRIDSCTTNYHGSVAEINHLRQLAGLAPGTDKATIAKTTCTRAMTAIAEGRMSYDDLASGFSANPNPTFFKVLKGR